MAAKRLRARACSPLTARVGFVLVAAYIAMPKRAHSASATGGASPGAKSQRRGALLELSSGVPSGECASSQCACQSAVEAVDAALKRVKSAPAFGGSMPSRGPLNEEAVLRAIVDDYLSHSRAAEDLKPKQVRLREALRRVAVKLQLPYLSTFNCKTTSLRTLGRALWEGCQLAPEPRNKAQDLLLTQKRDGALVETVFERLSVVYPSPLADGQPALPEVLSIKDRTETLRELSTNGIVLLRGFVPEETCEWLLSRACDHRQKHSPTWLTETMSLGRRGCYFDQHWNLPILQRIQERVVQSLGLQGSQESLKKSELDSVTLAGASDARLPPKNSKAVLLAYTQGGENWAHQDDNKEFAFQALLMLSQPRVDFTGGELYVLDGSKEWVKHAVSFARRGDLAVFRSNGSFFHGMDEVSRGDSPVCSRVAVGLFHKHA